MFVWHTLKGETCNGANFVATGGTAGCLYYCHWWRQIGSMTTRTFELIDLIIIYIHDVSDDHAIVYL